MTFVTWRIRARQLGHRGLTGLSVAGSARQEEKSRGCSPAWRCPLAVALAQCDTPRVDEFGGAYRTWMDAPFPAEDEVGVLHDDVALADTRVADSVVPYVKRGVFVPATPTALGTLRALRVRAVALGDAGEATEYLIYIDLLADLYEAFLHEGEHAATT